MSSSPSPLPTPHEPGRSGAREARANEQWWVRHGGVPWQEELDARRRIQPHYGQQEAFLQGLFLGLPGVRVLDFGAGYGRHLRNLKDLPNVEIHGCDMSASMMAGAEGYLADPAFFRQRVRHITPRSELPWPDGYFDVVFTSEVLITIAPEDLEPILSELARVSRAWILHLENPPVRGSRKESDEHAGCWAHDLGALYDRLGLPEPQVLERAIDRQAVYLVRKPGSALSSGYDPNAVFGTLSRQQAELERLRRELREVRRERDEEARGRAELRGRVEETEDSAVATLVGALERTPLVPFASRLTMDFARGLRAITRGRTSEPALPESHAVDLSFAGVATRASSATPLAFLRERPKVVGICHPDWRGIRAATYSQVDHVLEVPGIVSERHLRRLVAFIADAGIERLVINGYPPGIERLVDAVAHSLPAVRTYFVYHGTPAAAAHEFGLLQTMLDQTRTGALRKVGFVKAGLADYFKARGYPAEPLMNACKDPVRPPVVHKRADDLRIGVFGTLVPHKNVETQVVAALMIPEAQVHVLQRPTLPLSDADRHRLQEHGILPHEDFLALLGTMDATLYVSLVECYPMTVLESFFSGVLCLTSHTSNIFDADKELFEALVVTAHDSPAAIAAKLASALERRDILVPRAQAHLIRLNTVAARRFAEFIER
jgi:SAM-dependent methyltransferase/glycosyltransferase involved in cell wall biosynthesis